MLLLCCCYVVLCKSSVESRILVVALHNREIQGSLEHDLFLGFKDRHYYIDIPSPPYTYQFYYICSGIVLKTEEHNYLSDKLMIVKLNLGRSLLFKKIIKDYLILSKIIKRPRVNDLSNHSILEFITAGNISSGLWHFRWFVCIRHIQMTWLSNPCSDKKKSVPGVWVISKISL